MAVWQIATGEPGRDYQDIFFDYDVMILGPSDPGDARAAEYADGVPNSKGSQVHSFCSRPGPGDRVLMRSGKRIISVGQIPRDPDAQYSFLDDFACVYGWDLCHTRRVIWAPRELDLGAFADVYKHAKQKPSFTAVHEPHIVAAAEAVPGKHLDRPLLPLPEIDTSMFDDDSLGVALFQSGISNRNIEEIIRVLAQAERLCSWYSSRDCGRSPTENEIVSHIVLPLLLGLGWSHQQIAVEWKRVDMALFKTTPTTEDTCVMIVEAKGLGNALTDVVHQALRYVESLGLRKVEQVVTTDGPNLFVYKKRKGNWDLDPAGYLSVSRLQRQYVLPRGTNLVGTLVMLQPSFA